MLADRPELISVPAKLPYGADVRIGLESPLPIARAHLIKLGSTTHSQKQDQRLVLLQVQQTDNNLRLSCPASRAVAPPGHYLLFAVDTSGVPSEGVILRLGQPELLPGQALLPAADLSIAG